MIDASIGLLLFFIILSLNPLINLLYVMWQTFYNTTEIDLKRKFGDWAVITGSTDGIGKEYAKELAKRDINIVLISRSIDKLRATKSKINLLNASIEIKIIQADFSKGIDEIEKITDELKDIPVGILVNNVGILNEYPTYFGEISKTDLWNMINVNIGATTMMTQIVIDEMKKRKKGAIVNVSSGSDAGPVPLLSFYAASKTFIRFFSDAIREEYSKDGVTVQTLSPFFIKTNMTNFVSTAKSSSVIYPDAETYAKNAINTLGKLNSTAGYWIHDIMRCVVLITPAWLALKCGKSFFERVRSNYLKSHNRKIVDVKNKYPH